MFCLEYVFVLLLTLWQQVCETSSKQGSVGCYKKFIKNFGFP